MGQESVTVELVVSALHSLVLCVPISFSENIYKPAGFTYSSWRHLVRVTPSYVSASFPRTVKFEQSRPSLAACTSLSRFGVLPMYPDDQYRRYRLLLRLDHNVR